MTDEKRTKHNPKHPNNGSFCARCKAISYTDADAKADRQKAKVKA